MSSLNSSVTDCAAELSEPFHYVDYTQSDVVRAVFVVLYVVVIVFSLLGNAMVILTVARNRHMRTVTNFYVVNLATCDALVAALVMPLKALEYMAPACEWSVFRSDWLCSLVYFALPVFVFASVLTLIAISVERYVNLLHYHRLRGSASTVLTATGQVNGRWRILTPPPTHTQSKPMSRLQQNSAQLIISARGLHKPNLVQIHPLGVSGQMGEI